MIDGYMDGTYLIEIHTSESKKVKGCTRNIYRQNSLSGTFVAMLRIAFMKSVCVCVCKSDIHSSEVAWPRNRGDATAK